MSEGYQVKVRPEKAEAVEKIRAELDAAAAAMITEYRGLTVGELAELRSKLTETDTVYRVVKKTLARRAALALGFDELEDLFTGPVAIAYVQGDPVSAAKVMSTFAKDHPDLLIKGGVLEGRVIGEQEAKDLASVDPLDVSRAKIAGLLTAALRQIAMLAEAPARQVLYVLEQLASREGAEAPAEPAAEAPAEPEAEAPSAAEAPADEPAAEPAEGEATTDESEESE